jgi:dihydrofolate reductase
MAKFITLIAAMGKNREIGFEGRMPWHLPAELQHFKQATMGRAIVMGRKTWQAIGRPLPGRQNIVITRNAEFVAQGADVVTSLQQAIEISDSNETMVIGGGELYTLALPLAKRMILTMIDIEPQADVWFPQWASDEWQPISVNEFAGDDNNPLSYRIIEMQRV